MRLEILILFQRKFLKLAVWLKRQSNKVSKYHWAMHCNNINIKLNHCNRSINIKAQHKTRRAAITQIYFKQHLLQKSERFVFILRHYQSKWYNNIEIWINDNYLQDIKLQVWEWTGLKWKERDWTALYVEGRFVLGNKKAFPNEKFIRGRAGRKDLKIV